MSPLKPITVRTRRIFVVLAVLAVPSLPVAAWLTASKVNTNCEAIHRIVEAGLKILDSPRNLRIAYEQGKISKAQYEQSLAQIHRYDPVREQNLRDWRSGDCPQ